MLTTLTDNRRSMARWYGVAIGSGAAIALLVAYPAIQPIWVLLGLLVLVAIIGGLLKFPAVILVPVIFFPQWKNLSLLEHLQSRVDLTLVWLAILCIAVIFHLLAILVRGWTVRELFVGQGKGILAFFSFVGIVALSYLYTPAPDWGFTQATRLFGIGGLLFLSPLVLIREEKDFRQFAIAFLGFALIRAIITIFWPSYAVTSSGETYAVKTDIGGGWLLGMAILILFYYHFTESRLSRWLWRLTCAPLLIVGLVASTARGPMVALLLVVILTPLVAPQRNGASSKIFTNVSILLLVVTISVIAYSLLPTQMQQKYQEKTDEITQALKGASPSGTMGERLQFYKAALAQIPERPVLGLGVGGWSMFYQGQDERSYPHNLFLLVAVEEGLIGFFALVAFLWVVGFSIKQIIVVSGDRYVVLFALVFFCVVVSMFSGDLDTNRLLWLWCGMTFAFARMLRLAQETSQFSPEWERKAGLSYAFPTSDADRAY